MKAKYVIGKASTEEFLRVYDGHILMGASLTLKEARDAQELIIDSKIYELVEVKE